jgi:predicted MPP superfamily phosphohydrolase
LDSALLAMGGVSYGVSDAPRLFTVETIRLKLPRLPKVFSGIRVAQISDIHMGGWMNRDRFQQVADLIRTQNPEVLLITGDFLLGHHFTEHSRRGIQDITAVLTPLANSLPSFAVLGNHDYWTNPQAIREMLRSCGVTDLTNTVFTLTRAGQNLHLCGVDDVWRGQVRLHDVITQLHDESAAILLAHEPDFADISAATERFDLQVSGHTHGGQIAIPFLGPPVRPYLGQKYPSGLYKVGNMFQYTTRGIGMNQVAVRFNCSPEITIFELLSTG